MVPLFDILADIIEHLGTVAAAPAETPRRNALERARELTPAAKKTAAVALTLFLLLFLKYKPYAHVQTVADSAGAYLFALYFFVCNQSLGIVHEAGHGICYLLGCPTFITVLNGTLFQLLFPLFVALYARRKGHVFGALAGLFFTGFSLKYTAWYMSSAHESAIVPASRSFLGVDGYHDFHYLFSRLHLLAYDGLIASATAFAAVALMLFAVFRMLWLAFVSSPTGGMPQTRESRRAQAERRRPGTRNVSR